MSNKPRIKYPIVVEGRYDRQRIIDIFDADCISTDGFGIFNSRETNAMLSALSKKSMIIILTDSDSAGSLIRKRISQSIGRDRMINLYTPQIEGKERRKKSPSKQGYLGVEGMSADVIRSLLEPFIDGSEDACASGEGRRKERVTKLDLYLDGLSGGKDSGYMRDLLAREFSLPKGMTANALLAALGYISDREEYRTAVDRIKATADKTAEITERSDTIDTTEEKEKKK